MNRWLLILGILAAACSPAPQAGVPTAKTAIPPATVPPVEVSEWACGDEMVSAAFYAAPDRVELTFGDGAKQDLAAAMSETGAIYEGADLSFQTKEDSALLTRGDATRVCRRVVAD